MTTSSRGMTGPGPPTTHSKGRSPSETFITRTSPATPATASGSDIPRIRWSSTISSNAAASMALRSSTGRTTASNATPSTTRDRSPCTCGPIRRLPFSPGITSSLRTSFSGPAPRSRQQDRGRADCSGPRVQRTGPRAAGDRNVRGAALCKTRRRDRQNEAEELQIVPRAVAAPGARPVATGRFRAKGYPRKVAGTLPCAVRLG
jgi:hypothetical protein